LVESLVVCSVSDRKGRRADYSWHGCLPFLMADRFMKGWGGRVGASGKHAACVQTLAIFFCRFARMNPKVKLLCNFKSSSSFAFSLADRGKLKPVGGRVGAGCALSFLNAYRLRECGLDHPTLNLQIHLGQNSMHVCMLSMYS
jgi:hypothetical protein